MRPDEEVRNRSSFVNKVMRLIDLLEDYKTKDGREITMKRIPDSEGDENRGWRVDEIEAYVDGKQAGYIKLSYIPHARFHKNYPTVFNYADAFEGLYGAPYKKRHEHYKNLTADERREMLKSVMHRLRLVDYGGESKVDDMSDREVMKELQRIEEKLNKGKMGEKFRKFKNFHKDKPLVDFIRVYDGQNRKEGDTDFRRQRIGEALYREAAKWMKEKGMKMYASGLQSDEAKKSWDHMKKALKVRKAKRGRRTLEPTD
jgi:hypothetical protein